MKYLNWMIRVSVPVAIALCVLSQRNGNAQDLKMSEHERAVVQIALQKPDSSFSTFGTGFFIDENGTVATALHVYISAISAVSELRCGNIVVRRASRSTKRYVWSTVDVLKSDAPHDLALLKVKETEAQLWDQVGGIKPLPLSTLKEIEPETEVTSIGYFGIDLFPVSLSARLVGATATTVLGTGDIEEFLVSASAFPGQSGSPVILADGSVIGIMDSIVPVQLSFNPQQLASGLNRVVKVEHIQRLLSSK
jgi:S1-C subfamily serine protease